MSITDEEFEKGIVEAIEAVAGTWATDQKRALDRVERKIHVLDGMPGIFKAAAWMNIAAGAVNTLFPDSMLTSSLKKFNIPIFLANIGIDALKEGYKHQVDRFNQMMSGQYESILFEFQDAVNKAADGFSTSKFGSNILLQTMEILKKRKKTIPKKRFMRHHAIDVLGHKDHGVIETSNEAIYERTKAGYGDLCAKLKDLYEGTYDAPGFNRMTLHVYNADGRRVSFFQDAWCIENSRTKKKSCPDTLMVTLGAYTDTETLGLILDNLWRLKVEIDDGLLDDYLLMGADIVHVEEFTNPPSRAIDIVTDLTKGHYPDYRAEISKADELVWPRTLQMIQGKI